MSKIKLTDENLEVLAAVKKNNKSGITLTQLSDFTGLSISGVVHHVKRLKATGKVKQDRKTRKWFIK